MSAHMFSTQLLPPAAAAYSPSPYLPMWGMPAPNPMAYGVPPQPAPYVVQFTVPQQAAFPPPAAFMPAPTPPVNYSPAVMFACTPEALTPVLTPHPQAHQGSSAAAAAPGIVLDSNLLHMPADGARPVLVERFHTKLCRNHIEGRKCPYRSRCMFAHSEAELRSPDMNFRDGLFTEAAIRAFQQREEAAQRRLRTQQQRHRTPVEVWPQPSPAQSSVSSSSESAIVPSRAHQPYASRPVA